MTWTSWVLLEPATHGSAGGFSPDEFPRPKHEVRQIVQKYRHHPRGDEDEKREKHSFPHITRAEMSRAIAQTTYTTAVAMQVPTKPSPLRIRSMSGSLPQ